MEWNEEFEKHKESSMEIEILAEKDREAYEAFLCSDPLNLFFTSWKYKVFLERLLQCECNYVLAKDRGKILGALPLMSLDGSMGKVINSLPYYGSNGGIISSKAEAVKLLTAYYNELIAGPDIVSANYIENPWHSKPELKIAYDLTDNRIGQFTSLPNEGDVCDQLMNLLHHKTRNMVRKAMKSKVEVEIQNDAMDFLQRVHNNNMKAIGGKPKSAAFFKLVPAIFEEAKDYNIYVAKLEGEKIAACLLFHYNKTIEYYTPVIVQAFRSYQPLSLIIYQAMVEAGKAGYAWWNWGGTWKSQEGLYRFKSRWNTIDKPYRYFVKINDRSLLTSTPEELTRAFPGFYVVPFSQLKNTG